jgi:hypothetical protein
VAVDAAPRDPDPHPVGHRVTEGLGIQRHEEHVVGLDPASPEALEREVDQQAVAGVVPAVGVEDADHRRGWVTASSMSRA